MPVTEADAIQFWKEIAAQGSLPKMALLAKYLLTIPATSTPSERVFSACGSTLNEHRARMKTETIEKLMFLHYNMSP